MSRASILARQQKLQIRSAELRVKLGYESQTLAAPLALADNVCTGLRWIKSSPGIPLGALGAFAVLKPFRTLGFVKKALFAFRLYRRIKAAFPVGGLRSHP